MGVTSKMATKVAKNSGKLLKWVSLGGHWEVVGLWSIKHSSPVALLHSTHSDSDEETSLDI